MGESTGIAWTDHTFNPWWGCTKVAPECENCYADELDRRYGYSHWGPQAPRRLFGEKHWNEPRKWNRLAARDGVRRRVFCASMCDVFDKDAPAAEYPKLWDLIRECTALDWQILTKRPDRIHDVLPRDLWGAPHIWIGTSIGTQKRAPMAGHLFSTKPTVAFISAEPLLEAVDFGDVLSRVNWVIVGGESGRGYRPMAIEWARSIVEQCRRYSVAVFVKQDSAFRSGQIGRIPPELQIKEFPR